ncbi:antibiotic biosynthesis monooxygenase [Algiphilus sp. W345]|uniref:Antibiotic biosynthesis monooxygenase n=1 Tax=Banduia mediterranea TaxID=3075609 RepID=A0ABU2WJL8_9GAMM|nr:antibiotic biosynthesis monooxygenase [Algiphilus sp. W345]MDT0497725.1 antibiotic biosynthesis monooxygenase [Algiphilus sp. W345]
MVLTVFRSRLRKDAAAEYAELASSVAALAETMPGFRSRRAYTAEDGEKLTLVEFEDEKSQRLWARNLEHLAAQKLGRERFYSEYSVQVCAVVRESRFTAS